MTQYPARRRGTRLAEGCLLAALYWLTPFCSSCALSTHYIRPDGPFSSSDVPATAKAPPGTDDIETTLLLIGDAGEARPGDDDAVLKALRAEASVRPDRTLVVFLGDNIYPNGAQGDSTGGDDAALSAQVAAVGQAGGIFVPGNHDYGCSSPSEALKSEKEQLARLNGNSRRRDGHPQIEALPNVEGEPSNPGPAILDEGEHLRLVILDTAWWLETRELQYPRTPSSKDAVISLLADYVKPVAGRHVIVLAHHPLASHGEHGGFFSWRQHVFPLREAPSLRCSSFSKISPCLASSFPLPIFGSLYVLFRELGCSRDDLSNGDYTAMRTAIVGAFGPNPPEIYASGHDHDLQVLSEGSKSLRIVSGAGTFERPNEVSYGADTLFASPHPGFVRVEVRRDGQMRVAVIEVGANGILAISATCWKGAWGACD